MGVFFLDFLSRLSLFVPMFFVSGGVVSRKIAYALCSVIGVMTGVYVGILLCIAVLIFKQKKSATGGQEDDEFDEEEDEKK